MTIVEATCTVTGGIDTHGEVHVAAVLDDVGGPCRDRVLLSRPRGPLGPDELARSFR